MKCDICGKSPATGYNISHSKRHTKRTWDPNIQATTVLVGDRKVHLKICTRCQRTINKAG